MKNLLRGLLATLLACAMTVNLQAQGWPENYGGVMLQGFYWDSYSASKWTNLQSQAQELSQYFSLVWLPQSGNCGGQSMGYDDLYWFPGGNHYTSSFGTEAELRSLITTFKNYGIGTIADVVINHRKNVSSWVDFPKETYNGVDYELVSTDICKNDDGGKTLTWATQNGYSLSTYNDSGEGWDGMRDLDHNSANVQKSVKAYLKMLLQDLGYAGFRYDMVKGYSASFTADYNADANPQFSVGECWDGTNTIKNWIDGTQKRSAAFDFQFRYTVRNAANNGNWTRLGQQNDGNWPLISNTTASGAYKRYAVTFVENHDTERRAGAEQDPLKKDTLAANAYLLAMPGTPCIFLTHWIDCKQDIKGMIDVRKKAGIHNMSSAINSASNTNYYAVMTDQKLLAVVGKDAATYTPNNQNYVKVLEGYHYAYYLNKSMETAWPDKASGTYYNNLEVTLTAVSANSGAKLVYTTDGSTPTASSKQVESGTKVSMPSGATTLKVGLLVGGTVSGIETRSYNVQGTHDITVYLNVDAVNWTTVNFYNWGVNGVGGNWPGDQVTATTTIDGKKWYYNNYTIYSASDAYNFVFSTGTGSPQTVDVENVSHTSYFEVSSEKDGSKFKVNNVTSQYTGIETPIADKQQLRDDAWYTLSGQRVSDGQLPKGIYIHNGKKVVRK